MLTCMWCRRTCSWGQLLCAHLPHYLPDIGGNPVFLFRNGVCYCMLFAPFWHLTVTLFWLLVLVFLSCPNPFHNVSPCGFVGFAACNLHLLPCGHKLRSTRTVGRRVFTMTWIFVCWPWCLPSLHGPCGCEFCQHELLHCVVCVCVCPFRWSPFLSWLFPYEWLTKFCPSYIPRFCP